MDNPTFEIKPEKVEPKYGKFIISPLPRGYGATLGTALRRVMMTSLPGAAVTSARIAGVKHQFSTLKGIKEDTLDFLLNLKQVRFKPGSDKAKASLSAKGPGEVKAGDIVISGNMEVANPELVLANLSKGAKLEVKMEIESGVGYSPAEEREKAGVGTIILDADFSPVQRVTPKVEETRVGRVTNFDKLILEVWTDGTVEPHAALVEASKTLLQYLEQIINPVKVSKKAPTAENPLGSVGSLSVEEIGLPTRVANALSSAGFDTVEKLSKAEKADLVKVRNLGEKSFDVIRDAMREKGVKLNA